MLLLLFLISRTAATSKPKSVSRLLSPCWPWHPTFLRPHRSSRSPSTRPASRGSPSRPTDSQSFLAHTQAGPIYKHSTDFEAALLIRFIFTGGADTAVRVFKTAHGADEEPQVLDGHNEDITFLDCSVRLALLSFAFLKGQTNSS